MTVPSSTSTATITKARRAVIFSWLAWLALLASLPVAVLSVFRAIPGEWPVIVVQLLAFTPWLAVPAAFALVLALLSRRRWVQVLTGALMVCQLFWLFSLNAGHAARADDAGRPTVELKVMSLNAEFGQADAGSIVQLVRDNAVGLLTLQEHSLDLQDKLTAAGLDQFLPYKISDPTGDGAAGSAAYSRYPLEHVGLIPDTFFHMPTVRLTAESGGSVAVLEVTNVHALPPLGRRVAQWRSDLAAIAEVGRQPGHRLLVGDFNATLDHSEFRDILSTGDSAEGNAAGMTDVAAATGSRLAPTWPMEGQFLPGITIDHLVISAGVGASGYAVHTVPGTDHAAIMATLSIPAT